MNPGLSCSHFAKRDLSRDPKVLDLGVGVEWKERGLQREWEPLDLQFINPRIFFFKLKNLHLSLVSSLDHITDHFSGKRKTHRVTSIYSDSVRMSWIVSIPNEDNWTIIKSWSSRAHSP